MRKEEERKYQEKLTMAQIPTTRDSRHVWVISHRTEQWQDGTEDVTFVLNPEEQGGRGLSDRTQSTQKILPTMMIQVDLATHPEP